MSTTLVRAMSVPITSSSRTETGRVTFPNAIEVKPLKFDRDTLVVHPEEEIALAKQALIDNKPLCVGTANWFSSSNHWKSVFPYINKACHANLPYMSRERYKTVIALENGWDRNTRFATGVYNRKEDTGKNLSLPFLSWLLYNSPYGEFILNRDDFEFCANYGFIVSGELPHAVLMNLAILSRHFYECKYDCFVQFNDLTLEKGIDPTIAYAMCFNTYFSYYGESYLNKKFQGYSGHRVTTTYDVPTFLNLFNGEYGKGESRKMYAVGKTGGASSLFKKSSGDIYSGLTEWCMMNGEFKSALAKWRKPDADISTYKPPNPFAPRDYNNEVAILQPGQFTFKEAYDFVAEYIDAFIRKELSK